MLRSRRSSTSGERNSANKLLPLPGNHIHSSRDSITGMSQKSNQKYTWRGAKWIFYALPRLFLWGWIHRQCWRKGKGITARKWGLRYLNDVFIGRLALDKGWDIGDCPIHLYGDHFDRNGHGASGQDGCVDDFGVLQGKEKWIFMRQQEAGNGFPGYFISVHDVHVCSLHWSSQVKVPAEHLGSFSLDFVSWHFHFQHSILEESNWKQQTRDPLMKSNNLHLHPFRETG